MVTGDAVKLEVQVAQLPARAVARLMDLFLLLVTSLLLVIVLFLLLYFWTIMSLRLGISPGLDDAWLQSLFLVMYIGFLVVAPVIYETRSGGKTPGKAFLGLRVVSDDGSPIRFRQALIRGLLAVTEIYTLCASPAVLSALLSPQGKRIGDHFAGTMVISDRIQPEVTLPPMLPGVRQWANSLYLGGLTEQHVQLAQYYYRRFSTLNPTLYKAIEMAIAYELAQVVTPPPPAQMPPGVYIFTVLAERQERDVRRFVERKKHNEILRKKREQRRAALTFTS